MKELQNFVYRHMDALRHHKRYLAMLTALSMLVTFIVPLILIEPADSMTGVLVCKKVVHTHNAECYVGNTLVCNIEEHIHTNECYKKVSLLSLKGESSNESQYTEYNIPVPNAGSGEYNESTGRYEKADGNTVDGVTYNPAELPLYTLLFGEGVDWVNPELSLEDNLEIVDDEYFLGFASDFCAFIESDFEAYDADAEGRVFIGGDLMFYGNSQVGEWNYQVGAGDYGHFTPISKTDEYSGISGFASGIIGGKVYRLGTMTTGSTNTVKEGYNLPLPENRSLRHTSGYDIFLYPEEGAYKRFIVGNIADSRHLDEDYLTYGDGVTKDVPYSNLCNHLYVDVGCSFCGSNTDHDYLGEVNELSQFYQYSDVDRLLEKTFDTLRARSLSLASVQAIDAKYENSNSDLVLDASDIGDAKTVYFKVNEWKDFNNVIIIVPDDRITYTQDGDKELEFTGGSKTIKNLDLNIIISCNDESIEIKHSINTYIRAKSDCTEELLKKLDDGKGYKISNRGSNSSNNHPVSSNILYNFYYASTVKFTGKSNFNGTIFSPNADVTSPKKCEGHLSGALIAKSFEGGLEFGYRPYRGGVDIFGMTSGYAVPVNKVDQDGATLPGALFAIKEGGKFVSLFESGSGTNFAALPSRVDFTGGTYRQEIVDQQSNVDRYYAGNEVPGETLTAPVDFTLYYFDSQGQKQTIENNAKLPNVLTKFYLEANQEVDFDYNENIRFEGPVAGSDGKLVYTVYLIKPVTNVEITARNKGDNTNCASATVNFNPMTLTAAADVYKVDEPITLTVGNLPTGDTISYKYFVNGNFIDLNDDGQDNDYTPDISCTYTPSAAGDLLFSVEAYVEVNGQRYNIARATDKKYIANTLPNDMAIELYTYEGENIVSLNNNTIKSGEQLIIRAKNIPDYASVTYSFNGSSNYNTNDNGDIVFDTSNIIGRDLTVKVTVSGENETVDLYSTVTVDFPDMELKVLDNDKETEITEYVVNSDTNDKLNFSVSGIPTGATVKYYFNNKEIENNGSSVDKTVVGENIPVRAVVSYNGMEKTLYGSVTGKYNDGLKLNVEQQAGYIVGNEIKLNVTNAPNGANVVFSVYDSNGNFVKTLETKTVENGEAWSSYTPEKSGSYYFKATMTYGDNPVKELSSEAITVVPVTLTGELSVTPNQVSTGNEVTIKVYGATIGADVTFTVEDQNGNAVHTISGLKVGDNGECKGTYKPTQAGSYTVKAAISMGDTPRNLQNSFTAIESTSALSGTFTLSKETITPGSDIDIVVSSPNNGAVVNIKITNPNGKTYTQSANINNGAYSFTFNPANLDNVVGVYTVSVELVQGTSSQSLGEQKFTVSSGNDASGEISVSPESIVIGNSIDVNITNAPVGANVAFKYYYYDSDISQYVTSPTSATIGDEGTYNLTFSPAIVGKYTVKATITTANGSVKEVETSFYAHAVFEIDNDGACVAGQWHNISVSGIEKQTISSVQQFTIEGQTVSEYNIVNPSEEDPEGTKPYISFRTSEQYTGGTYNLYLKIQLSGGAVTEYRTQITNNAPATLTLRNTSLKNASFLKSVNILADESTVSDNLIEITPEEAGERISSVRLTFPDSANAKNNTFKLAVTFTDSSNKSHTMYYDKNKVAGENPAYIDILTSEIPGDADIDEENITKISITSVAGSIAVDKCYPTYVKAENQITKTYTKGFTLNPNEQKEIVIENWLETLDSITFNLESDGEIFYALIGADETETLVSGSAKSENGNKKIEISGINDNIKKIKIFTKQESPLTVKDYTIIGFTGDKSYNKEELQNNEWDVINYYTLVEQQAPVGYFKEETVYTIEVKETVDLATLDNGKPKNVLTTISLKDKNGIVVLSYKVNTSDSGSTRTITIDDVTFTLTKSTDGILTVTCSDSNVITSNWGAATKPVSNDGYYFDPAALMIVPVPTPVKYTNRMGFLFRKIDDNGAAVKGVKISLVPDKGKDDADLWHWDKSSSEWLIDYTKLLDGTVYKLTETEPGDKYERADDIYFTRTDDKEITYWTGSSTMPTEADKKTVLDLTDYRVIKMVDVRVLGIKLSLDKFYKDNVETPENPEAPEKDLEGAKFSLYSNDGVLICSDLDGNGNIFDNEVFKKLDNIYVENGYLKPGMYYLTEDVVPMHPTNEETGFTFENPGKMYFTIESDFSIKLGKPSGGTYNLGKIEKHENGQKVFITKKDETVMNGSEAAAINDVVEFVITGTFNDIYLNNIDIKGINKSNDTYTHTFATPYKLTKFELQRWGGDGVTITSLRIKDKNDNVYQYPASEEIPPTYTEPTGVLSTNGATLKVENKVDDGFIDIPVSKKWVGDVNFEELRSEIEVKLYRTTTPKVHSELTDEDVYKIVQGEGEQATETEAKVTLNDANKWSHVFEKLPSFYFKDGDTKRYPYYYYIKETIVPHGYNDSYSTLGDGTLVVTNTLQTVNINAQKFWDVSSLPSYENMIPDSIVLKVQWSKDNGKTWKDISSRTITVNRAADFKGVFKKLPKGYKYRIVEAYSANGWVVGTPSAEEFVDDNNQTFTITNVPKIGSFTIQKDWLNDSNSSRPENIYIQLRRAIRKLWPEGQPFESVVDEYGNITEVGVSDDYARLLQYSLYFYDGNMCGDQVDENTAYTWRGDCHTTRDGDYTGGFHDAGDHVMFGLPAGYTASMLGWSMYEFPESFEELNQTAHMKAIEDYYCDFFMKCAKYDADGNITAILYQKGNGTPDHAYWGMPEKQDEVMKTEADAELYWTDDKELNGAKVGGDIASEYAAALAIAYLNYQKTYKYYDDDAQKYDNYLEMAKKLFAFALENRGCVYGQNIEVVDGQETGGYYKSTSNYDDLGLAAVWLHIATRENETATTEYKTYLEGKTDNTNHMPGYGGLNISWNDVGSAAAIAYALHVDSTKQQGIINSINSSITNEVKDDQGNVIDRVAKTDYMFGNDSGGWGQMRHNAAYQTSVLIANKFNNTDTNAEWAKWCKTQMDVILGNNTSSGNDGRHIRTSTCYVTNFAENTLIHPHYRATSGMDVHMQAKNDPAVINGYDIDPYKLIGGLAGGWKNNGQDGFVDERLNYEETEVATDYNAGLVCAAAGLYGYYKTGHTYEIPGVKTQYLQLDPTIEAPEMIYVGDSVNLNITGFDDVPSITWEIVTEEGEEPKAEIANDGKLTANKTGLVKVRVSGDTVTGVTRSATAEIMVYEQASISVPNGTVEENGTYIMEANTEMQLTAENFEQDAEVEWSVTNTDGNSTYVASIDDNGKLTANDAGTVIVKAASQYKRATIKIQINSAASYSIRSESNNTLNPASVDTSDTDAVMDVLMSYAIRQTTVRVLDDESITRNTSYKTLTITSGTGGGDHDVANLLSGLKITSIDVVFDAIGFVKGRFRINGSWDNNYVYQYEATLTSNILSLGFTSIPENIQTFNVEAWEFKVNIKEIRFNYESQGIKITNTETELVEGDTITLNSSGATGDVTWYLNDSQKGTGTSYTYIAEDVNENTTLKFKAVDSADTANPAEYELTVVPFEIVDDSETAIDSINISTNNIPYQLKTNGSTSGSYVWKSDNQNIVIDRSTGQITSASGGTANITVTREGTQISDSITVNVVGSLTFNNPISTLYTGGDKVTYSVNESDTYSNITWEITENTNNAISIKSDTGEVTILNAGSAKIKATARDNNSNVVAVSPEYSITVQQLQVNNANNTTVEVGSKLDVSGWSLNSQPSGHSKYVYSSENEQYAVCSNNEVTGVKAGNVNIIVKSVDNNGKVLASATKQITVNNKPLEISVGKNTLVINETATLNYSGDDVVFEGYDNSIIKIENNTITGLKGGSTTITARRTSDDASKEITITVNGMSINTNGGNTSVDVGSELDISSWSINNQPYGHDHYEYSFSTEDQQKASYSNGKVTGVKSGTVNIIVQSVDSSGNVLATATQEITVNKGSAVETPDGYEFIGKVSVNQDLYTYNENGNPTNEIVKSNLEELDSENVDCIIVEFTSTGGFNGVVYYNGNYANNSYGFNSADTHLYQYEFNTTQDIDSVHIRAYYTGGSVVVKNIYFYSLIPEPEITTPEGTTYDGEYVVLYKGDTLNLTAKNFHGDVSWSALTDGFVTVTGNGTTAEITADNLTDEVIIQATSGDETASIKVKVLPQPLIVNLSPSELRAGSNSTITVTAKGETIEGAELTISPEGTGITIENNVIKVPAGYNGDEVVTITASKDGYANGVATLTIKPGLVVSPNGNIVMNVGDIKKFSAYNAIGDVTWESLTPEILSVDEKGNVTAKMFGSGKIQVSDEGTGEPIVIEINVQQVGVTVKLPENSEIVGNYTLTYKDLVNGSWQQTIGNLPYVNEYGDEYYYYIVETDANGNPVTAVTGNGVSYIPIYYTNNGLTLNDINDKALSVGNAATEKPQGLLPSTGGSGARTYYYFGGALMLLGIAGFTGLKRRERKRRKE